MTDERELEFNTYEKFCRKPMVCIGLGGMGSRVALTLRWKVFQKFGLNTESIADAEGFPFVKFLCVDTANIDQPMQMKHVLASSEFLKIGGNEEDLTDLLSTVSDRSGAKLFPHDDASVIDALESFDSFGPGAGRIRMFGRSCLLLNNNLETFQERVTHAFEHLRVPESDKFLPATGGNGDGIGANVLMIFSLAGGTGSGTFIDAAAAVNDLLHRNPALNKSFSLGNVTISAIIILPTCLQKNDPSDIITTEGNAYAALKELDHFISGNEYSITIPGTNRQIKISNKKQANILFRHIYLFEGVNDEEESRFGASSLDPRYEISDEVSDFVLAAFLSEHHDKFVERQIDWVVAQQIYKQKRERIKVPECTTRYSSFGISTAIVPVKDILNAFSNSLMDNILRTARYRLQTQRDGNQSDPQIEKGMFDFLKLLYSKQSDNTYDIPENHPSIQRFSADGVPKTDSKEWEKIKDQIEILKGDGKKAPKDDEVKKATDFLKKCINNCQNIDIVNSGTRLENEIHPSIYGHFANTFKAFLVTVLNNTTIPPTQLRDGFRQMDEELDKAINFLGVQKGQDLEASKNRVMGIGKQTLEYLKSINTGWNLHKENSSILRFFFNRRKVKYEEALKQCAEDASLFEGGLKSFFVAQKKYVSAEFKRIKAEVLYKILMEARELLQDTMKPIKAKAVNQTAQEKIVRAVLAKTKEKIREKRFEIDCAATTRLDLKPQKAPLDDQSEWLSRWKIWPSDAEFEKLFSRLLSQVQEDNDILEELSGEILIKMEEESEKIHQSHNLEKNRDNEFKIDDSVIIVTFNLLENSVKKVIKNFGIEDTLKKHDFHESRATHRFGDLLDFSIKTDNKIRTRLAARSKSFIQLNGTRMKAGMKNFPEVPKDVLPLIESNHPNKLTVMRIESGFSAKDIRAIHDWRRSYLKQIANGKLVHCYDDAANYMDFCVDSKVRGMDVRLFLDLLIILPILFKKENQFERSIDAFKGMYFSTRLIKIIIPKDTLLNEIVSDTAADHYYLRHLLVGNYLEKMKAVHSEDEDLEWTLSRTWIKEIFDGDEGKSKYFEHDIREDFGVIKEMLNRIEIENVPHDRTFWGNVLSDMLEDGFIKTQNGQLELYIDEFPKQLWNKTKDVTLLGSKDAWSSELSDNLWVKEKLATIAAIELKSKGKKSEAQRTFLNKYYDGQRDKLPEDLADAFVEYLAKEALNQGV